MRISINERGHIQTHILFVLIVVAIVLILAIGQYNAAVARGQGRVQVLATLALMGLLLVGGIGAIGLLCKGLGRLFERIAGMTLVELSDKCDALPTWKRITLFWLFAIGACAVILGIAGIVAKNM